MHKIISILLLTTCYLLLTTIQALAFTSQDGDYIFHMQIGNGNQQSDLPYNEAPKAFKTKATPTPPPPTPTNVPIKILPPKTTITLGYGDKESLQEFKFSLADDMINFGPLSPTDFITRTSMLTVSGDSSYLYSIMAFENTQLLDEKNSMIPNTRCDDGNCTQDIASDWTDPLTFGFGYHCENIQGNDCANFSDKDSYKSFSVGGNNLNGAPLMSGQINQQKEAELVYKLNVPGTQPTGTYQNTITYLAIPNY